MSWSIPFASQSRDQTISEALEDGVDRIFQGEEHRVFIELLFAAPDLRVSTMGQLKAHIEGLDQDGRRRLLDKTRKGAGLPTTGEVEDAQQLRKILRDDPPRAAPQPARDQHGALLQSCAAGGCEAMSTDAGGAIAPVRARRWHCPKHLDQATPGDLDDWEPDNTVQLDPRSGALILDPEAEAREAEFYARQQEQRAEERRKHQEQLRAEAERIRILEEQRPKPELRPGQDPCDTWVHPMIAPDERLCRHEAGHTAAAILLRRRVPLEVTADRPEDGVDGGWSLTSARMESARTPRRTSWSPSWQVRLQRTSASRSRSGRLTRRVGSGITAPWLCSPTSSDSTRPATERLSIAPSYSPPSRTSFT